MKLILLGLVLAAASIGPVWSQDEPSRIGNVWNGKDHQPTRSGTARLERSDGVQPAARHLQSEDRALNQLDQQLLPGSRPPVAQPGGTTQ